MGLEPQLQTYPCSSYKGFTLMEMGEDGVDANFRVSDFLIGLVVKPPVINPEANPPILSQNELNFSVFKYTPKLSILSQNHDVEPDLSSFSNFRGVSATEKPGEVDEKEECVLFLVMKNAKPIFSFQS